MEIPASLLMSSGTYAYVAVKGSLHASDSAVFGLQDDEIVALAKRFSNYQKEVVNGVLLKAAPIQVVNALGQLGYRVVCTTGEAEIMCECGGHSGSTSQTLDELAFERGLWYAAQYGDIERVTHLIDKGFRVDERDAAGYTSLHYASRNGHLNVCKFLLDKGANVNACTCQGKATALHRAATAGHYEIVKLLLDRRADFRLEDSDGRTALHRAAIEQHSDICGYLLKLDPELKHGTDRRNNKPVDYVKTADLKALLT